MNERQHADARQVSKGCGVLLVIVAVSVATVVGTCAAVAWAVKAVWS